VPKKIGVDLGAGKRQRPFATIEGYRANELVLAVAGNAGGPVAGVSTAVESNAVESEYWNSIRDSKAVVDFEAYLKEYPTGAYASLARLKVQQLRAAAVSVDPGSARPAPEGVGAGASAVARPTGDTVVDLGSGVRIEMVVVPAGTFDMGSNSGDADEKPVHRVTISKAYLMGKYEVTQGQWKAVMGKNPSHFTGNDELPVEQVSWDECQEYIRRLNAKTGMQFRLPTEAEWEYACRAGSTGDWAGSLDSMGWYYENAGRSRLSDSSWSAESMTNNGNQTHPVGQKQPNGWGLFDMHGNVWEWCQDWYDENYYGRSPGTDPAGAVEGSNRVFRGGCWFDTAARCRSANLNRYTPASRGYDLGFRLAGTP
jgi:formylglycine-generating enzyme required for sulfatase activity